jgi:hypothetical protein
MTNSSDSRRLVDNELVFREYNERIQHGFDNLDRLARQEGRHDLVFQDDEPLHFYCECSDENCVKRIQMKPSEYSQVHEKRNRFVAIDGHDVPEIERIVSRTLDYIVVEKMHVPSHVPDALHATSVDNVS